MSEKRLRLDQLLVQRGYFESRAKAQAAIMAGEVYVDGQRILKAGTSVTLDAAIEVKIQSDVFVSRGGHKLHHALKTFGLDPQGLTCIDVGASTGGFTDCLLQMGAAQVIAVDVGYGQLAWKLRQDPRVVVVERTNFRHLVPGDLPQAHLVVIDVSFISLTKILPVASHFLYDDGHVIALIKPQFEVGKGQVGKKGIVKNPDDHRAVLCSLGTWAKEHGWQWRGLTYSPITGAKGNIEFLAWWQKRSDSAPDQEAWTREVDRIVSEAHATLL